MPQAIEVDKERIAYLMACLDSGKAIEPCVPEGWRHVDYLMLAGAALAAALSQGPVLAQPDLTPEQQVEADGGFVQETNGVIQFLSQLCWAVVDDDYDVQWERKMTCIVRGFPPRVTPGQGWRGFPGI